MFIGYNKVRMHDTDMAGRLYFPRQFRFVHDALEDFLEQEGLSFDHLFHKETFVIVIVHTEADYFVQLKVGDQLEVHVTVENIGTSSFTMKYRIFKKGVKRLSERQKQSMLQSIPRHRQKFLCRTSCAPF